MTQETVYCGYCGAPLDQGSSFCGECGRKVDKPIQKSEQADGDKDPASTKPQSDDGKSIIKPWAFVGIGAILLGAVGCIGLLLITFFASSRDQPIVESDSIPIGDSDTAYMLIINQMDEAICAVYISPSESDDWGYNWLVQGDTLQSGDSRQFAVTKGHQYDIMTENCSGMENNGLEDVFVDAEGVTITLSPP